MTNFNISNNDDIILDENNKDNDSKSTISNTEDSDIDSPIDDSILELVYKKNLEKAASFDSDLFLLEEPFINNQLKISKSENEIFLKKNNNLKKKTYSLQDFNQFLKSTIKNSRTFNPRFPPYNLIK